MDYQIGGIGVGRRAGLAEQIAGALGVRIVSGQFNDFPSLPTETEIQSEYGVSRTAVREAIRLLSAKGLLVSRPKTGTKVRPRSAWNMLDQDVLRWQLEAGPESHFVENLFDMRRIFEPAAAGLAAEHATADDIQLMHAALESMIALPLGSLEQVEADLSFHKSILQASGNPLLRSLGNLIESALIAMFRINWQARSTSHSERMAMHRDVYSAIAAHRADDASKAMEILIASSKKDSLVATALASSHVKKD